MTFSEFQKRAMGTAIYPKNKGLVYAVLGLSNEAGELAGKLKKFYRDGGETEPFLESMKAELSDVLWYCAAVAEEIGVDLNDVAEANLTKLADRQQRGVLGGSGDNR